jgi:hypothetical protein
MLIPESTSTAALQACKQAGLANNTTMTEINGASHLGILSSPKMISVLADALELDPGTQEAMQQAAAEYTRAMCGALEQRAKSERSLRTLAPGALWRRMSSSVRLAGQAHCR